MAPIPSSCPIAQVAVQLLSAAGAQSRLLFLDPQGQLSGQPHWLPQEQALLLASNQQIVMGPCARVQLR